MFPAYTTPEAEPPHAASSGQPTSLFNTAHSTVRISGAEERKSSQGSAHGLNARSCTTCRRRKVKCDKNFPCSNCLKTSARCVFPPPGRAPRRARQGAKPVSQREAELLKRLSRLEGVVEELSGQVELEAVKHSPSSDQSSSIAKDGDFGSSKNNKAAGVRVIGMDEGTGTRRTWISRSFLLGGGPPKIEFGIDQAQQGVARLTVDEGQSSYVSSQFWSAISDEVAQIRENLAEADSDSDSEIEPAMPSSKITDTSHQSFIMGYSSSDVDLSHFHPLPSQIPFYWQTFLENVNPLVKILHVPTMNKVIKEVQNNLASLSSSTEALMFSIYFGTITSMSADEVRNGLGAEKNTLLKQYRFGVEQALARAGLLNTHEIVTLQAFAMFLICVRRHDDTRFVWSLTGLLTRISQSLGIHRDGTKLGLSPFDTEMRRRLWWLVCILDMRSSEDHGVEPGIHDYCFDTKFPLNINDEDLDPEATEPPEPREGVSEMTFSLIRFEICSVVRKLTYTPPGLPACAKDSMTLEEKEQLIKDTGDRLEAQYLIHCENAGPLSWVAATISRLILAKMSLIVYHPLTKGGKHDTLTQTIRDRLMIASIEIIEYSRFLESEASTKKWGWLFQTYIQWHAVAFILAELGVRPPSPIVERGWRAIDAIFDDWAVAVRHSTSGSFWIPMRKLMARALRMRQLNMKSGQTSGSGVPAADLLPPADRNRLPPTIHDAIARDRQLSKNISSPGENSTATSFDNSNSSFNPYTQTYQNQPTDSYPAPNATSATINTITPTIASLINDLDPLAPSNLQFAHQLQLQQMQPHGSAAQAWIMDGNAFGDLDMNALEEDVNWEGWDDLVKDIQMGDGGLGGLGGDGAGVGAGVGVGGRGTGFGGMGGMKSWW